MSGHPDIADLDQRRRALDPRRSFIVQAPAGSGKTELLIQRYLVLLARVNAPEEIAAITFTRRAAAQMRMRVLEALAWARTGEAPREPHRALTWQHARAVIERDRALGWRLEQSAARLRIQTIDALCASLTRQMPVLAAFGAQPQSIEDALDLYREAARATLALLEDRDPGNAAAADLERLLAHLDNNAPAAQELIAGMLQKRDHWLRNLRSADDRASLEAAFAVVRGAAMAQARLLVPTHEAAELLVLAAYGADNLAAESKRSPLRECADIAALPGAGEGDLYAWLGLAELLLTAAGEWRKTANVNLGFPAGADKEAKALARECKQRHAAWIGRMAASDDLRAALQALRGLPPARYSDAQWEALGAIMRLLPRAVAELKLVFATRGEADFVEISQGALAALGEPEAPSDLMLALDYRIRHILVDEFQDTSFSQFELLEKLTAGWAPDDGGGQSGEQDAGRTLFVVGDPMQSIYRFREAEVGLFLKARSDGIGPIRLAPLTLSANFRSQAGIVDWVNRAFADLMPRSENAAAGAVPYSPSDPVHPAQDDALGVHAFFNGDAHGEAERVAALIELAQAADPEGSVAILVRNRSHLERIVPRLKARGLRFRAIEIEHLGRRQVVQDLLAVTRALSHPADRIAWLAVLRAPWCGLTLADLHALVNIPDCADTGRREQTGIQKDLFGELLVPSGLESDSIVKSNHATAADHTTDKRATDHTADRAAENRTADNRTVWELLHDQNRLAHLCADGRARATRLRDILARAMSNRLRGSLRERVESAWFALGGPACVEGDTDLEDAGIYLDYLETAEEAGEIADLAAFEQGLAKLYALPDLRADPQTAVQIMTIHKAKGLEFDTVILPGLGRVPRRRNPSLFLWTELPTSARASPSAAAGTGQRSDSSCLRKRESSLLLAPIKETGTDADRIYDYLVCLDAEKESHETGRLLYVAATRAKKHLHLLGDTRLAWTGEDEPDLKPPSAASLLAKLWPAVEPEFAASARNTAPASGGRGGGVEEAPIDQDLRRLPADWIFPEAPPAAQWPAPLDSARAQDEIEFSWAGETARHVGSVVHRWLQRIAEDEMKGWSRTRVEKMRDAFRDQLAARGVQEPELAPAVERVARALAHSLDDPRGKWLLGTQGGARNEYRITAVVDGERRNLVIDRTFTDSDGRRWIVDYKTSGHEGAGLEAFLDRERARYAAQLARYARALGEEEPARLGLYFPLVSGWRDWQCES